MIQKLFENRMISAEKVQIRTKKVQKGAENLQQPAEK